jgi:hypothetical protein
MSTTVQPGVNSYYKTLGFGGGTKKTGAKFLDRYQISLEFAPAWLAAPVFGFRRYLACCKHAYSFFVINLESGGTDSSA